MKLTLLLAFVAVTASVAYAAPKNDVDEETAIQEFLEKALKQSPQDHKDVDIQDFLASMQQADKDVDIQDFLGSEQEDDENVDIQDFLGSEQEDDKNVDIQDFLGSEQEDDENVDIQDLLGSEQEDDENVDIQDDDEAELQEFFAKQQIPAHMQGWWSRTWRKAKKIYRKVAPYVRHGIRIYKHYRRYRG